jgi:hypothetical protein
MNCDVEQGVDNTPEVVKDCSRTGFVISVAGIGRKNAFS